MTYPAQLLIGGINYAVKEMDDIENDKGELLLGQVEYHLEEISLRKNQRESSTHKVLMHEITHAFLYEYGMDKYNKEDFVDRLSFAFFDFLSKNDMSFLLGQANVNNRSRDLNFTISTKVQAHEDQTIAAIGKMMDDIVIGSPAFKGPKKMEVTSSSEFSPAHRPRSIELMGPKSTFPISDILGIDSEEKRYEDPLDLKEPDFWKSGIKVASDGETKLYRTHYECPNCDNKGKRYIPDSNTYIHCHGCNVKIEIEPATPEGFPMRDEWGNFFKAYFFFEETEVAE